VKIIIPAIAKHKVIVMHSISRLSAQFPGADVLIVCPQPKEYSWINWSNVTVEADDKYIPISKNDIASLLLAEKRYVVGWYYQQILKYAIVIASNSSDVLILDADTVLIKNFNYNDKVFYTSKEKNAAYFEHFRRLFNINPKLKASAITNFMWFNVDSLREMLYEIEARHKDYWWLTILKIANAIPGSGVFSEYETYANWIANKYGPVTEVPIHIFRRGDLLAHSEDDYGKVISSVANKNYDAVAFEIEHKRNVIRQLCAWIVLTLAIRAW